MFLNIQRHWYGHLTPTPPHCCKRLWLCSAGVTLCSSSTFMIFTAFQRLVDSDDCPGSRKSPLLLTMPVNWCVAAASLQQVWASEESSMPVSGWSQEKWLMRICSLTHSDWRKRAAWGLWPFLKWNERGWAGGVFLMMSCLHLEGRKSWMMAGKVLLGVQAFRSWQSKWITKHLRPL